MPACLLVALSLFQAPASPALAAWRKLDTPKAPGKQDDLHFVSPTAGWYVNGAGKVFRTADGGDTWTQTAHKPSTYFRCVAFLDEKTGFAGNIGPDYFPGVTDKTPLYRTADGGTTWAPVEIAGDPVKGLCALQVARWPFINAGELGQRVSLFGGGRVGGPAVLVQSRDGGATWTARDLSRSCGMVLDVHWFDDRTSVVAAGTSADVRESHAAVLLTTDAGDTWQKVYDSGRPFELTWKLSFPSRQVGYVTVQSYDPAPERSQRVVAKTTDGGKTWTRVDMGPAANKVRVLPTPTGYVAYAVGTEVRKLTVERLR